MRRLADVDEIDLVHARFADADGNGAVEDAHISFLARFRLHDFRIVEAFGNFFPIEDHSRRDHRARERPAARFVDAGDGAGACFEHTRLENVVRHGASVENPGRSRKRHNSRTPRLCTGSH